MKLKEGILSESINQVLDAALTLFFLGIGINYFLFGQSWQKAIGMLAKNAGLGATSQSEINLIFSTVANTFPFNYITQRSFTSIILVGAVLTILCIVLKLLTVRSRAQLAKDFGQTLFIPGIAGLLAMGMIQYMTASSLNNVAKAQTLSLVSQSSNLFIWSAMGSLIIIGLAFLFIGYILDYVMKSIGGRPIILFLAGRFLISMGWIFTVFYAAFRLVISDIFATIIGDQAVRVFTIIWYLSHHGLITALGLFVFGVITYRYGKRIQKTAWGRERPAFVQKLRAKAKQEFYEAEEREHQRKRMSPSYEPQQIHLPSDRKP